jgi:hypothetical protein
LQPQKFTFIESRGGFKQKIDRNDLIFESGSLIDEILQLFSMFERQVYLRGMLRRQAAELVLKFN